MSNSKFYVLPTIDTEGVHGDRPFEQFALGEVGEGEDWGALRIARIFRDYGVSGTFFVDVYEHSLFGEKPVADLCERLVDLGQNVELHTHPSWRDDLRDHAALRRLKRERAFRPQTQDFMAKLSLADQVEVLEHGIACLQKWIGYRPVVHRSGGYSIDANTVGALQRVGISADSSMNVAHSNSRLTWSRNRIVERQGILELPVTVAHISAGIAGLPLYRRLSKTDLSALSPRHLRTFCSEGQARGLRFMNYFMHSYSLLSYSPHFERIGPDHAAERNLRDFLAWATAQPWIEVVDAARFAEIARSPGFVLGTADPVPEIADTPLLAGKAMRRLAGDWLPRQRPSTR